MTQSTAQIRHVVDRSGFANPLTLGVLVEDADYLKVYADDGLLQAGIDYTVLGIGDANGVSIEIIGGEDVNDWVGVETFTALYDPALQQGSDLSLGGSFGRAFESALDQQNRRLQATADRVTRSLKLPVNVTGDIVLPPPEDGYAPAWDETAQAFKWVLPSGLQGEQGPQGPQGDPGQDGLGVPAGGTTGQVLKKASDADNDTEWADESGGDGSPDGSENVLDHGATGDGSTDDTAAIQAAIDAAGSNGTVIVPPGTYRADGLRLDGTGGTLSGVTLKLMAGATIKARAAATNNVVEAVTGSKHRVYGPGKISGSKDTGGTPVRSPTRGFWAAGASYTVGETVEVSSTDTATTTIAASNLVYTCTSNHTAGATFLADKATKWTLSASANYNDADLSYRYRNGIYFGNCTDVEIVGVEIEQCVYAAINLGSGPVQAANIGGALTRGRVAGNNIHDCENGMAGGVWRAVRVTDNLFRACDVYGIVADIDANENIIAHNSLLGVASLYHAIFMYDAEHNTIADNKISGVWANGIVIDAASHYTTVIGNTIDDITNVGIFARSSVGLVCNDNVSFANAKGIQLSTCGLFEISGNQVYANSGDGILIDTFSYSGTITGNFAYLNGGAGIYLSVGNDFAVSGNACLNNVTAGIRGTDAQRVTVSGNACYDTAVGGAKTQVRGVLTDGTSNYWSIMSNMLIGNLTSATSLVGANNLYAASNDNGMGLGVDPTAGDGLLQFRAGTTKADGLAFGNDTYLFRAAAGYIRALHASDTNIQAVSGSVAAVLRATAAGVCVVGTTTAHDMRFRTNDADRVTINATTGDVTAKAKLLADSPTGGIGYATGAGGVVTQATSKSTGVTLSKVSGQITMNAAALAANTTVSFTLTNTAIAAGDILVLNHVSGGTAGAYALNAQCAAGSASINVRNITAGSLSEAIVISFAVIKAVTA